MKAIFVTGGKQYYVSEGDTIYVEKLNAEVGSDITFNEDNINALINKINVVIRTSIINNSNVPIEKIWFVTKVNNYKEDGNLTKMWY